jgi:hypothetical protein
MKKAESTARRHSNPIQQVQPSESSGLIPGIKFLLMAKQAKEDVSADDGAYLAHFLLPFVL